MLPFKNAESTLRDCIISITKQSFPYWELIAVDDHSTDRSKEIITEHSIRDSRIKCFYSSGSGIADALNFGITRANSSIVARMDADDIMMPDRLREQFDLLELNSDVGLVSCLVRHVQIGKHDTRGYQDYVKWINNLKKPEEISLNRFIESPFAHPSVMFRIGLLGSYGGYKNGDFPEDYELWLRLLENNVKMFKLDQVLLEWRDSKTRLSRNDKRYSLNGFQKVKAKYLKEWLAKNISPKIPIHCWGAGKNAKKQIRYLLQNDIVIQCIYEVDRNKIRYNNIPIKMLHFEQIPIAGKCFLLILIGKGAIRQKIKHLLESRGYRLGKHYLLMA